MAATAIESLPRAAGAPAEPPLTDAQHNLRRAIAAKAHQARQVAGICDRLRRLDGILARDRELEATIRELTVAHQEQRALWLESGSDGPEPRVSRELLEARLAHTQLQSDVAASMGRLPAVQAEHRQAVEMLTKASTEAAEAAYVVAIAQRASAGFRAGLNELAKLHSVVAALRRTDTSAGHLAATAVEELIRAARATGVEHASAEVGQQLLERLAVDPLAVLR
jgi:hypothetical protein